MALNMTLETRRPDDVIQHSDRGSQYTAIAFGKRCEEMGVSEVDQFFETGSRER
jgi:putative transposase